MSGLSISAFCRDRKLSPASFFDWRRKLADRELASAATGEVRPDDAATGQSPLDRPGIVDDSESLDDVAIASKFVALDLPLSVSVANGAVSLAIVSVTPRGLGTLNEVE